MFVGIAMGARGRFLVSVPARAGFVGKQHDTLFAAMPTGVHAHTHHAHHIDEHGNRRKCINRQFVHVAKIETMNDICKLLFILKSFLTLHHHQSSMDNEQRKKPCGRYMRSLSPPPALTPGPSPDGVGSKLPLSRWERGLGGEDEPFSEGSNLPLSQRERGLWGEDEPFGASATFWNRPAALFGVSKTFWNRPTTLFGASKTFWNRPATLFGASKTFWNRPATLFGVFKTFWK
jgi:hypothetical protein